MAIDRRRQRAQGRRVSDSRPYPVSAMESDDASSISSSDVLVRPDDVLERANVDERRATSAPGVHLEGNSSQQAKKRWRFVPWQGPSSRRARSATSCPSWRTRPPCGRERSATEKSGAFGEARVSDTLERVRSVCGAGNGRETYGAQHLDEILCLKVLMATRF